MRNVLRLAAAVSIGIFAGSVTVSAQNYGQLQAPKVTKPGDLDFANGQLQAPKVTKPGDLNFAFERIIPACPVSLRAQHGADGGFRKVDKSKPEGVAQLLHLILTSKDSRQIVEARLRVRGVSPIGRVSNARTFTNGAADATRNVSVRFTPSGENEVSGRVWVPGLSAVLEVELNGVTFNDGSMQRFSSADGCRFIPEHTMLIAKDSY